MYDTLIYDTLIYDRLIYDTLIYDRLIYDMLVYDTCTIHIYYISRCTRKFIFNILCILSIIISTFCFRVII